MSRDLADHLTIGDLAPGFGLTHGFWFTQDAVSDGRRKWAEDVQRTRDFQAIKSARFARAAELLELMNRGAENRKGEWAAMVGKKDQPHPTYVPGTPVSNGAGMWFDICDPNLEQAKVLWTEMLELYRVRSKA